MNIFESTFEKHKKLMLESMLDDNAIKNKQKLDAAKAAGIKLVPITTHPETNEPIYIYDNSGRPTVVVDMGGFTVPFYVSSGLGGKKSVAVDKWYPFFGIGSDGWFNKASEEIINNFYYSDKLKSVSTKLDSTLGVPRRDLKHVFGWSVPTNKYGNIEDKFINTVNKGLSPATRDDTEEKFINNVNSVLRKLGATKQLRIPGGNNGSAGSSDKAPIKGKLTLTHDGKQVLAANISTNVGARIINHEDSKFFDRETQFQLQKQKDDTWKLIHNKDAKNSTNIDDKEVTEPTILVKGMKISLGRTRKFPMEVG